MNQEILVITWIYLLTGGNVVKAVKEKTTCLNEYCYPL